jgi:hypothetical protein
VVPIGNNGGGGLCSANSISQAGREFSYWPRISVPAMTKETIAFLICGGNWSHTAMISLGSEGCPRTSIEFFRMVQLLPITKCLWNRQVRHIQTRSYQRQAA